MDNRQLVLVLVLIILELMRSFLNTWLIKRWAIHCGSDCKGFVVVFTSYQIAFEAQGSISIVNRGQLHFCIKNRTPISCVLFLVNFLVGILGYDCCATCMLQLCDVMLNFL